MQQNVLMSFLMNTCVHVGFCLLLWAYLGVLAGGVCLVLAWVFCGHFNFTLLSSVFLFCLCTYRGPTFGSAQINCVDVTSFHCSWILEIFFQENFLPFFVQSHRNCTGIFDVFLHPQNWLSVTYELMLKGVLGGSHIKLLDYLTEQKEHELDQNKLKSQLKYTPNGRKDSCFK